MGTGAMRSRTTAGVAFVALLSSCGGGGSTPASVALEATSSDGSDIEITYETADGEVTEVVASPWTQQLERTGSFDASLVVRNTGLAGDVSCVVAIDQMRPLSANGESKAICSAIVSRRGGVTEISSSTRGEAFTRNGNGDAVELDEDLAEPQRIEADDVVWLSDTEALLSGHKGVWRFDTSTGAAARVEGSTEFGNPLNIAAGNDGSIYALNIFKDLLQALPPDGSGIVDVAEFPDESPAGLWLIDDVFVVFLGASDTVVAVGSDGVELWRHEIGEPVFAAHVAPLGDGRILVGADETDLVGLDLATGAETLRVPVRDELAGLRLRDGQILLNFSGGTDDIGGSTVIDADAMDDVENARSLTAEGRTLVFAPDGTPYAAGNQRVMRLDPETFDVERTIELPGKALLAVGPEVMYVTERVGSSSDDLWLTELPLTLFD